MELTQEFFNHLLLLLGLMYGFTTLKIVLCKPFEEQGEEFSWKKLFLGTAKQIIVISGTIVVYLVGTKCGADLLLIQVGDSKLTIQGAVDVTILAVVAVYGAKYIKYLAEFMGIKTEKKQSTTTRGKLVGYVYEAIEEESIEDCYEDGISPVSMSDIAAQTSFNKDTTVSDECEVG